MVQGSPGSLAYGVLVNASALHGAPIFMNLVNSAALQAVTAAVAVDEGVAERHHDVFTEGSRPENAAAGSTLPRCAMLWERCLDLPCFWPSI